MDRFLIFILCLLALFGSPAKSKAETQATIRLTVGEHVAPNAVEGMKAIYYLLFDKVGRSVELIPMPLKRSEKLLGLNEQIDGDAARTPEFANKYPELVMVEEATATSSYSVYAHDPDLSIESTETLASGDFLIAYPAGNLLLEKLLVNKNAPAASLVKTWSTKQGLGLLRTKRVDVFVDIALNVDYALRVRPELEEKIHVVGAPIEASFHIFLRSKHAQLAEELSVALRKMKVDGLYQVLLDVHGIQF